MEPVLLAGWPVATWGRIETMNFFKVLMRPDYEERENGPRSEIAQAANILQIGEFQLLQLAYREWRAEDLPEAKVSILFSSYMIEGHVPHWARHFARQILDKDQRGEIDDSDPTYHQFDHDYRSWVPGGRERFVVAVAVLVFTVGGGIWFADQSVRQSSFQFPPFFSTDELKPRGGSGQWGRADHIPATADTDGAGRE
jgi:hypothetical protein